MQISTNPSWTIENLKARIDPPPIPRIKTATEDANKCDIIKIKMLRNPDPDNSDTYELKIAKYENIKT